MTLSSAIAWKDSGLGVLVWSLCAQRVSPIKFFSRVDLDHSAYETERDLTASHN